MLIQICENCGGNGVGCGDNGEGGFIMVSAGWVGKYDPDNPIDDDHIACRGCVEEFPWNEILCIKCTPYYGGMHQRI